MSVNSEKRNSILVKIKSLLTKTTENGCTEAEALSAAEMVGKLMNDYDLTMSDLEFQSEEFVELKISTKSKVASYMHNIVSAIASYTDCMLYFKRADVITYTFFGSKKDTQIAEYLYHLLNNSIKLELENYKKSDSYKNSTINGRTKTTSFSVGMGNRLNSRLFEMKNQFVYSNNKMTDIVPVNKKSIVEKEFSKKDMNLKTERRKSTVNSSEAYLQGHIAGGKVNITTSIKR